MNFNKVVLSSTNKVMLYMSGCSFNCENCVTKEYKSFEIGELFTSNQTDIILNALEESEYAGLVILGGDPMQQDINTLKELVILCNQVHALNKRVWIWSGFTYDEIMHPQNKTDVDFMRVVLLDNIDYLVNCKNGGKDIIDVRELREGKK